MSGPGKWMLDGEPPAPAAFEEAKPAEDEPTEDKPKARRSRRRKTADEPPPPAPEPEPEPEPDPEPDEPDTADDEFEADEFSTLAGEPVSTTG